MADLTVNIYLDGHCYDIVILVMFMAFMIVILQLFINILNSILKEVGKKIFAKNCGTNIFYQVWFPGVQICTILCNILSREFSRQNQ